jgi:hypothetical protein
MKKKLTSMRSQSALKKLMKAEDGDKEKAVTCAATRRNDRDYKVELPKVQYYDFSSPQILSNEEIRVHCKQRVTLVCKVSFN